MSLQTVSTGAVKVIDVLCRTMPRDEGGGVPVLQGIVLVCWVRETVPQIRLKGSTRVLLREKNIGIKVD